MLIMFARKNKHKLNDLKKSLEIMLNQMPEDELKYVSIYDTGVVYAIDLVEVDKEKAEFFDYYNNNKVVDIISKKEFESIFK